MPSKEFTDKNRFKSSYSENYVSAAQYLAEVMCARMAEKEGVKLPWRFWQTNKWKKPFLLQILHANKWLKLYEAGMILKALKDPQAKRVYSLGLKSVLEPIFKREEQKEIFMSKESLESMKNWDKEYSCEYICSPPPSLPTRKNLIGDLDG